MKIIKKIYVKGKLLVKWVICSVPNFLIRWVPQAFNILKFNDRIAQLPIPHMPLAFNTSNLVI